MDGVDDVVDAGHPCHAGKHEVHTSVMLLHRGGGTAIPHHRAIIILVAGVPQCPLDDTGGRVPCEDQRRDAEPPEVDPEISRMEGTGGMLRNDDILRARRQLRDDRRAVGTYDQAGCPATAGQAA